MIRSRRHAFNARRIVAVVVVWCMGVTTAHGAGPTRDRIERVVDAAIRPVMARYGIAGMAVGVTVGGRPEIFDYGVASRDRATPITHDTLFELGSISKTFTATLASLADVRGDLSLAQPVLEALPMMKGRPFGNVRLLELATHTAGGFPLQVPDGVHDEAELLGYLSAWRPIDPVGTRRTYANPSIGTLGLITARRMRGDFATLIDREIFMPLGMTSTFYDVPAARASDYAQGYTKKGAPIRLTGGVLAAEAYGVKSTAADMLRWIAFNLQPDSRGAGLQRAVVAAHVGYYRAGPMTQALIWERYAYPVALPTLRMGNAPPMNGGATAVTAIVPPRPAPQDAWINKTGSTNGFGAYVAFVPARHLGIVILANRNYPIEARVTAAYRILTALARDASSASAVSHSRTSNSSW